MNGSYIGSFHDYLTEIESSTQPSRSSKKVQWSRSKSTLKNPASRPKGQLAGFSAPVPWPLIPCWMAQKITWSLRRAWNEKYGPSIFFTLFVFVLDFRCRHLMYSYIKILAFNTVTIIAMQRMRNPSSDIITIIRGLNPAHATIQSRSIRASRTL